MGVFPQLKDFFRTTKFKVLVALMAVIIGVMIYSLTKGGYASDSESVFGVVLEPFQKVSNTISGKVTSTLDMLFNAKKYYEENQQLRKEIADLNREVANYEELRSQLEELQSFVGIREAHEDITFSAPCEIIGYVDNDPFGAFQIDGGSEDGISLYDPVVTEQGLVGVITELGDKTATVTTILSPDVSVAVYCSTTKDHGVLTGSVGMSINGLCRLQYLDKDTSLREGKTIVTSGENGLFPKGYMVGYVKEVGMEESGLTAFASVEPAADLSDLSMVVVITNFDGKEVRDEDP